MKPNKKRSIRTSSKKQVRKQVKKRVKKSIQKKSKNHFIIFCEPANITYNDLKNNGTLVSTEEFKVNDQMYKKLLKEPKSYKTYDNNAYVFGKLFPLESYKKIGEHGNDVAMTGIIDLGIAKKMSSEEFNLDYQVVWDKLNGKWDYISGHKYIRKLNPSILWFGQTVGGDVGAEVYGHKDSKNNYDSFIIDNNYFFDKGYAE
jgi:hypothetical protein